MAEIPADLFEEWRAFYRVFPWGERRADLRSGIIAAVVAKTAGTKGAKASDFMVDFDRPPKPAPMSDAEIKQVARSLFKLVNRKRSNADR